jgi:hypothetical protein
MKFILLYFLFFQIISLKAQSVNVLYKALPISIALKNPERGFYIHTEVFSKGIYEALVQTELNSHRSKNITLLLRVFYLENFIRSPISSSYLNNISLDFIKIRNAGLKCIVRFAYSNDETKLGSLDADKAQILAHIRQLKPILQANADVVLVVQAGFIGTWGEWYYTDHFGFPDPTATDYQNRKEVVDAIIDALPSSRMVQIRTPFLKQTLYSRATPITDSEAFKGTNVARIGHHNDCFLASDDDYGTYTDKAREYPYLEQETKYSPMGGETCSVNAPRSQCTTALNELQKFHWSYLNNGYHPTVINGFKSGGCYQTIFNRLGYRFELLNGTYPQAASIKSAFTIKFSIFNRGFASPFNNRTVYLVLRNTRTNAVVSLPLKTDIRLWSSGVSKIITETILVPLSTAPGDYALFLNLPDASLGNRTEYSIALANENIWEPSTGYNSLLHTIKLL